jgi:uncharacterized protein (UPF0216 family)
VFGRVGLDQNENTFLLVNNIYVFNNISESININLNDRVEFEVIKAVTGTDVMYFGINLLTIPKSQHFQTRIRGNRLVGNVDNFLSH